MGTGTGVLGGPWNGAPPGNPGHRRLDDRAAGRRRRGRRARASDRLRHARGNRRRAPPADRSPPIWQPNSCEEGRFADAEAFACFAESHAWEDDIVTQAMWRVARAQMQAACRRVGRGGAPGAARQSRSRSPPISSICKRRRSSRLRRVLREAASPQAAGAAARARAVYELKGNVVGARSRCGGRRGRGARIGVGSRRERRSTS